jgi:hypothetical protein
MTQERWEEIVQIHHTGRGLDNDLDIYPIAVELFDECKRLRAENERLAATIRGTAQMLNRGFINTGMDRIEAAAQELEQ